MSRISAYPVIHPVWLGGNEAGVAEFHTSSLCPLIQAIYSFYGRSISMELVVARLLITLHERKGATR
eukprot:9355840-Ditylum_brightwellii.AAC.1